MKAINLLTKNASDKNKENMDAGAMAGGALGAYAIPLGSSAVFGAANKEKFGGIEPEEILKHLPNRKERIIYRDHSYTPSVGLMFSDGDPRNKHSWGDSNMVYRTHKGNKMVAAYIPSHSNPEGKDMVLVPEKVNEAALAHELAHSTSKQVNSKLGIKAYAVGKAGSGLGMLYGAYKGSKGEKMSTPEALASAVPALGYLPEETRANILAGRAIYKLKGTKGLLSVLPVLAASEASYAGMAASPLIANKVARLIKGDNSNLKTNRKDNK